MPLFPAKSRTFEPAPGHKSLLVLFFRKEQESSFSEEKEAKRLLLLVLGGVAWAAVGVADNDGRGAGFCGLAGGG
jgi:hypothetical protein